MEDNKTIAKALSIYNAETENNYGYNVDADEITSSNYTDVVKFCSELDENNVAINIPAPISWDELQTYVTKAKEYFASLPTKEDVEATKASAKAKLIAGEALTEDEANTIVL
tara:strand:- start:124 stop:459 length:336 start_codon:yes stop_codon:yes gene_type:complete